MPMLSSLLSTVLALVICVELDKARANPVNVTIDDQLGDALTGVVPTYLPSGIWQQGMNCSDCSAKLEASMVTDGTWHDSTWNPGDGPVHSIEMAFNGSAIYVFCILSNWGPAPTNLSFTLDGDLAGSYVHIPIGTAAQFEYNKMVYSIPELSSNIQHHLTISTAGTTTASLVLFDYALRTADSDELPSTSTSQNITTTSLLGSKTDSTTVIPATSSASLRHPSGQPPRKSNLAPIVGGIAGGIVSLLLVILFAIRRKRLRKKSLLSQLAVVDPMDFMPSGNEATEVRSQSSISKARAPYAMQQVTVSNVGHNISSTGAAVQVSERLFNHEELMVQLQQIQQAVAALQSQQQPRSHADDQDLRRRILVLQAEMERIQDTQEDLIRERNNVENLPEYTEAFQ